MKRHSPHNAGSKVGPGCVKNAVVPTIIVKDEDREPLRMWQVRRGIPVHIWHVFYDVAYGLAFDRAED